MKLILNKNNIELNNIILLDKPNGYKILYQLIEKQQSISSICDQGYDHNLVNEIANLFYKNEYKRKQSVIGPKISEMSFDNERRYQITNKYIK